MKEEETVVQETTKVDTTPTFDEVLSNKEYQSEFDKRVSKALETAKQKWGQEVEAEKTEAEKLAKMKADEKLQYELDKERKEKQSLLADKNAYELKEQALKIASEKSFDADLLTLIDFRAIKAEELDTKLELISDKFNKALERKINERFKEESPKSVNSSVATFTKEQINKMTPDEINKNWDVISKQLQENKLN